MIIRPSKDREALSRTSHAIHGYWDYGFIKIGIIEMAVYKRVNLLNNSKIDNFIKNRHILNNGYKDEFYIFILHGIIYELY